ncbi:helix-turn-helix domain-containing protein [Streptomyces sp. NPDC053474]|uniref:helix-turn-helix domain-containing protein n=1 Tax=Streptomyces sp. NPDC053474 TaxID=3365704 RepID=UPI0037D69B3D
MRVPFSAVRLRHWMLVRAVTDEELASRIGRSVFSVGGYRRGRINPPLPTVRALAEALEVAPSDLMDLDSPASATSHSATV